MRLSGIAVLSRTADFIIWSFLFPAITGLVYGLRICRGEGPSGEKVIRPDSDRLVSSFKRILPACREQKCRHSCSRDRAEFPLRRCPRIIAIQRRTDPCVFGKSPKETSANIRDKAGVSQLFPLSHPKLRPALDTNTAVRHPPRRRRGPCRALLHAGLPYTERVIGLARGAK
jgi:hypothetical protein